MATKKEQSAVAEQREAERSGSVAFHHRQPRDACPISDADPLRQCWFAGWDAASKRPDRFDMKAEKSTGWRAFKDGLHRNECPFPSRTEDRAEWLAGWNLAQQNAETEDERIYR